MWRRTFLRDAKWMRLLKASGHLFRAVRDGVRDMADVSFAFGEVLPSIP